jgi:hypothetical protein
MTGEGNFPASFDSRLMPPPCSLAASLHCAYLLSEVFQIRKWRTQFQSHLALMIDNNPFNHLALILQLKQST